MTADPFASKAEDYARYRVDYPVAVAEWMAVRAGLSPERIVVELGSGTGMLTRHLLPRVHSLHAVEPSLDMRCVAEAALGADPRFRSVAGCAEETRLPDACADAIVCGNAFHYFDPSRTRMEAERILRGRCPVVVVFHGIPAAPGPFMQAYLALAIEITPPDMRTVQSVSRPAEQWPAFFGQGAFESVELGDVSYALTWDALRGRFASTSVAPRPSDPAHGAVFARLKTLFEEHQVDGVVPFAFSWKGVAGQVPHGAARN